MIPYASVADVRLELKAVGASDDPLLFRYALAASRRIDRVFFQGRPLFVPYRELRRVPLEPHRVSTAWNTLMLPQPLLALLELKVGDHTVALADVELWPPPPAAAAALRLLDPGMRWWQFAQDTSGLQQAHITGIWGYHSRRLEAWEPVDVLTADINATVTTLTVADVDGEDANGLAPRLAAGHLIRIDDEYLLITRTNTAANVVTARRGMNGTTAAAHAAGAPVAVWRTEDVIRQAASRLAAQMYVKRGAFEGAAVTDGARWDFPPDLAVELYSIARGITYDF